MSTPTEPTTADRNLASVLAHRAADHHDAARPSDNKVTRARLEGACLAAYALGYDGGGTETALWMMATDYVRANPRPRGGGAWNTDRKTWDGTATTAIATQLAAWGPNRPRGIGIQCPDCGGWGLAGCTCAVAADYPGTEVGR